MRAIKFRVWDGERMHYTSFGRVNGYDGPTIKTDRPLDCTWMQYTGLKDKKGVEIYEGDVLHGMSRGMLFTVQVKWIPPRFEVVPIGEFSTQYEHMLYGWDWSGCEVKGNIYEHPHLLEREVA